MPPPPTITVHIPPKLRECCDGSATLTVQADNVQAALAALQRAYPSLHRSVCDESGAVRRHIGLFVNSTLVARDALDSTAMKAGDEFSILPAVSGG